MKPPPISVLLRLLVLAVGVGGASGCTVLPAPPAPPAPAPAGPAPATPSALVVDVRGSDFVVLRAGPRLPWRTVIRALDGLKSPSKSFVLIVDGEPTRRTGPFTVPYAAGATGVQGGVVSRLRLKQNEEPIDLATTITTPIDVWRDGEVRAVFPPVPPGQDTNYFIVRADADAPFASVVDAVHAAQSRGVFVAFGVAPPPRAGLRLEAWEDCPFPPEADAARIDEAGVLLRVRVDASGRAVAVTVIDDPGHGFGDAARACALRAPYDPARDDRGQPMESMTNVFRVHFNRPPPGDEKR